MNAREHPSQQALEAFHRGLSLPEEILTQIVNHICECNICQTAEREIADDAFVDLIRAAGDAPPLELPPETRPTPLGHQSPPQIGGFGPLKKIGEGGMATVYKASQRNPRRDVALKFIKLPSDARPDEVLEWQKRFQREAESAGRLSNESIVTVYGVGSHEGNNYIVMEYVDGGPLTVENHPLGAPWEEAKRVAVIAKAIHYAHEQGILHRDLKPANVLLRIADGTPKVTDFGLAKQLGRSGTVKTQSGRLLGTPSYMAPEQVTGSGNVDPRTAVYGLGAILYERLTGRPPYEGDTAIEVFVKKMNYKPLAPSKVNSGIHADLETVCMKCLEGYPEDRYQSALELAKDLERWSVGDAILAKPHSIFKRTLRLARKYPAAATLLVLLVVVAFIGGAFAFVANREAGLRQLASDAEAKTRTLNIQLVTDRGIIALGRSNPAAALFHLTNALELARDRDDRQRYIRTALACTHDTIHTLRSVVPHTAEIRAAAKTLDSRLFAFADTEGVLRIHDLKTGKTSDPIRIEPKPKPKNSSDLSLAAVSFTPKGDEIVTAAQGGGVFVVDVASKQYRHIHNFPGPAFSLAVSPDGKSVAVGGLRTDGSQGSFESYRLEDGLPAAAPFAASGQVDAVAFSPDGRYFAASGRWDNGVQVWNVLDRSAVFPRPLIHPGRIFALAFSPDGSELVTGCIDGGIRFWDVKNGVADGPVLRHSHPVRTLSYQRTEKDGDLLLSGSEDGTTRLWDVGLRAPVGQPLYHSGNTRAVLIASYESVTYLVTTGFDEVMRVWNLRSGSTVATLRHPAGVASVALIPDSPYLLTGCRDAVSSNLESIRGAVRLWEQNVSGGWTERYRFDQHGEALAVAFAHPHILSAGNDGNARVWSLDGLPFGQPFPHGQRNNVIYSADIRADGKYIAFAGQGTRIQLFDATTRESRVLDGADTGWIWTVAFSRDGKRLLTDGRSGIRLWEIPKDGPLPARIELAAARKLDKGDEVRWSAFSPKGDLILGCGLTGQVGVWTLEGDIVRTFLAHEGQVYGGAFDPTQELLATVGADHTAKVWSLRTGELRFSIPHDSKVLCVAFSPNGKSLVTGSEDGTVRVWSSADGAWEGPISYHQGAVTRVLYIPKSSGPERVVSASNDGTVRIWTIPQAMEGTAAELREKFVDETGMAPVSRGKQSDADPIRSDEGLLRIIGTRERKEPQPAR